MSTENISNNKVIEEWRSVVKKFSDMTDTALNTVKDCSNILDSFESSIFSFHKNSIEIQNRKQNTSLLIKELDTVNFYHSIGTKSTFSIEQGLSNEKVKEYIDTFENCMEAKLYLEENMPTSSDITHLNYLIDTGQNHMINYFESCISQSSKPTPVKKVVEYLNWVGTFHKAFTDRNYEKINFALDSKYEIGDIIDETSLNYLELVSSCARNFEKMCNSFVNVYIEVRGEMLIRSFTEVSEHFKKIYGVQEIKPTTTQKSSNTLRVRKTNHRLSHESIADIDEIRANTNYYVNYTIASVVVFINYEINVMNGIIPEIEHSNVMKKFISVLLKECDKVLKVVAEKSINQSKADNILISMNCLISLLAVIEFMLLSTPVFNTIIKPKYVEQKNMFQSLISGLTTSAMQILQSFTVFKHGNADNSETKFDANVHEYTSNTIRFLVELLKYSKIVGFVLEYSKNASSTMIQYYKDQKDFDQHTWSFMKLVIDKLQEFIRTKAETASENIAQSMFIINNFYYIKKNISANEENISDDGINLLKQISNDYDSFVNSEINNYETCWLRVTSSLAELNFTDVSKGVAEFQYSGKNLSKRVKNSIKDAFKNFNTEFEKLCSRVNELALPDEYLQDITIQKVLAYMVPTYESFLNTYKDIPFARSVDKYIKYTPKSLGDSISSIYSKIAKINTNASVHSMTSKIFKKK